MLLKGKVALITGGARGIGRSIAVTLAKQGAHIAFTYLHDRSSLASAELTVQLKKLKVKSQGYQSDASDYDQAAKLIFDIMGEFGKIDICINNAGTTRDQLLLRLEPEDWNTVITANLTSVYNITRRVLPYMRKAKAGSIINISSIVAERGNIGQSAYAASKAGIIGFTKSVAREVAPHGVRCNAVAPGLIDTDMTRPLTQSSRLKEVLDNTPMGRLGTGQDVADAVLFLASGQSSFITGQVISVCGGLNI